MKRLIRVQKRYTYLILIGVLVFSGVLTYDAFTSYINPYLTASQIVKNPEEYLNQEVQIIGSVVNGSTSYHDDTLFFNLTDGEATIRITYTGSPPQNFMEGEQVVTT
ncbi:cytochrome c maturation protein CcmE, partial [Candidatus Pacearchaeota archaeon]|nr:cytochrome c maturation protein CcmE [Candidatus Pacearchaeota archaeon]